MDRKSADSVSEAVEATCPQVRVAVGVIFDAQGRVCIAKRPEGKHLAGLWEFPGGKVEAGESVFDALQRELHEELGLDVHTSTPIMTVDFDYPRKPDQPGKRVCLLVHRVVDFSGEAHGREGQQLRWVPIEELDHYTFPEANAPIIRALLPP